MSYKLAESVRIQDGKTYVERWLMRCIADADNGDVVEDVEIVVNEIEDTSRWSTHHRVVFKLGGKYYESHYSRGATEEQDESPYEYDGEWIEVTEVVPKEVTVIQYVKKEAV